MENKSLKLEYLSEVMDSESGEISKPFTIAGKNYQMVRAITPDRKKVMGVYCMDEMNEDGTNKIYDVKEFEDKIANKHLKKENTMEPETKPNFEGYKHFIVNNKTGKARKFKNIEELAKAQMGENEKYMGVKEFKKFVDEALFGSNKRGIMREEDVVPAEGGEDGEKLQVMAQKMMTKIQEKIPSTVFDQIRKNQKAQAQVISAFAELIGVPKNKLATVISSIKQTAQQKQESPVAESRIIKVKDIKK